MPKKREKRNNKKLLLALMIFISALLVGLLVMNSNRTDEVIITQSVEVPSVLKNSDLNVDFSKAEIDLNLVLSGGPGKDGIPAITDPTFVRINKTGINDEVQAIVVKNGDETKVYPYNILVWHEIVNDNVGGEPLAITFCPLCGSAIVFERTVDGEVIDFGVSGFLYESNLLMYSREDSESLYSQSLGRAVAGKRVGEELQHYPMKLLNVGEVKQKYPNALIMTEDIRFGRNYDVTPYSGYEDTEQTYFPVSVSDKRFPAKEIFYIVPLEGLSIAFKLDNEDGSYEVPDSDIVIDQENGVITARWGDAELPGYYEMWFSWATHNQDTGIVIE